jgi:AIPR protein
MSANDKVLLDSLVEERRVRVAPDLSPDDFFELFVSEQVLWDHNLSWEEIQDGVVDGGDDGGIDSIFAFLNDKLLVDDDREWSIRNRAHFTVYILQTKTSAGFSEVAIGKLRASLRGLFNLDYSLDDAQLIYNAAVITKFRQIRQAYVENASKFPSIDIRVVYASRGSQLNPKVTRKARLLEEELGNLFSASSCTFEFVTPTALVTFARRQRPTTLDIRFAEAISTNGESVLGLVSIDEYYKFVTTDSGALRSALFESNVRDYEGNASINASIRSTLSDSGAEEDFWWLNNGVTVVASRVAQYGKRVSLEYPQIVNGLQTTREIFEFVRGAGGTGRGLDSRSVLVRVIVPTGGASRDRIIRATNSQTTIPSVALRATDRIQRDIEDFFRNMVTTMNDGAGSIRTKEILSVGLCQFRIWQRLSWRSYCRSHI